MSLIAFLDRLHQTSWAWQLCGQEPVALDRAYDMTLSKFLERPVTRGDDRRKGPDCRRYYRGFLQALSGWRREHPTADPLEEEIAAAGILQRYLVHQFRKSCEEVRRAAKPARSRYTWRLPEGTIVVYIPVSLAGKRRRKWLEDNIDHPDPHRPGERRRVQEVIDARLGTPHHRPLDGYELACATTSSLCGPAVSPSDIVVTVEGLAKAVADEKSENLRLQRPAIQELGRAGLRRFILQAFRDLRDGCYQEKHLALQFKLSRPTVSRFAGSRWRMRPGLPPKDLWANVAQVLASNNDFVAVAKGMRIWPQVQQTLLQAAESRNGRRHHA
jgi:hypothetical protein